MSRAINWDQGNNWSWQKHTEKKLGSLYWAKILQICLHEIVKVILSSVEAWGCVSENLKVLMVCSKVLGLPLAENGCKLQTGRLNKDFLILQYLSFFNGKVGSAVNAKQSPNLKAGASVYFNCSSETKMCFFENIV